MIYVEYPKDQLQIVRTNKSKVSKEVQNQYTGTVTFKYTSHELLEKLRKQSHL